MKSFWVSFGQAHTHRVSNHTIDKDCLVELTAESKEAAHDKAMEMFNKIFHRVYDIPADAKEKNKLLSYFPRGIIKL